MIVRMIELSSAAMFRSKTETRLASFASGGEVDR